MNAPIVVPLPGGGLMGTIRSLALRPPPVKATPPPPPPPARPASKAKAQRPKPSAEEIAAKREALARQIAADAAKAARVAAERAALVPMGDPVRVIGPSTLTVRQKILVAAVALDAEVLTAEDLIVRAFELFPESFSMRGHHARYPDSNRVLARLSGSDGVCARGWLERVGIGIFRVTKRGKLTAKGLGQ